ncbi:MAG: hypothetical protein KKB70_08425 [Proteobacteria bacterium]|nr:hypothetical protein [Pseudomonadota bacterium]MBU1612197.1 hypothetical protein [Pseudomonadota bacterium]
MTPAPEALSLILLWKGLGLPLIRLTGYISLGLFVGNLIETLNWTHAMSRVAAPLARMGRLKDIAGASFATAFFSGVTANIMLAEAYEQDKLSTREVVFANLFNSMPTYFLHLPTIFMIAAPFIGYVAAIYVGLTAFAAILRTGFIVLLGHLMLPPIPEGCIPCQLQDAPDGNRFDAALRKTWSRFLQRLPRIMKVTIPIYCLFFFLKHYGIFTWIEESMAAKAQLLVWLPPEAITIVVFHMVSEFTAGLAVAGSLISDGSLTGQQIVLALLAGNILSSPMRAIRHQFPYYAGIFRPALAARLIIYNQLLRATSILIVTLGYWLLA